VRDFELPPTVVKSFSAGTPVSVLKAASHAADLDLKRFQSVFAAAIYSAISLLYFHPVTLAQLSQSYRGLGADPTIHMWAMTWWPYAIAHRFNPLMTPAIFAPTGYNLARAVSIPGPSLLIYPVTRVFGPVVAYNVCCLVCPAAAGFSAFVLCRYLCGCFWPAVLGGYMFGFSQYVLSEESHLFLLFIFPIPLAIYLVLLRFEGVLRRYSFLALFVLVMAFEFLSSTELFATSTVFAGMALALSLVLFSDSRAKLVSVIADIALSYAVLMLILSPYLYHVLVGGIPQVLNPPDGYSNDLLAFGVPTPVLLGGKLFAATSGEFRDVWSEMSGYLGPGAWLIVALFAGRYWRRDFGRLLLLILGLIAVASLGPILHVAGIPRLRLPWLLAEKLPLLNLALPGRFGMYLFLVTGVIVAIYFSSPDIPRWLKTGLGACVIIFILPNVSYIRSETTRVDTPVFFRSGEYKRYLSSDDNILILPNTITSTSQALLWQTETDFYFRSVTGFYLPPEDYQRWPITSSFVNGNKIPYFSEQLDAFLGAHQVKAIVVDGASAGPWPRMLSEAGMSATIAGGVFIYRVPPQVLASFRRASAHEMAEKEAAASFDALLTAANKYMDGHFPLPKLAPSEAYRLGLLGVLQDQAAPADGSNWWQNLWLGNWGSLVGIGDSGNYDDLAFLVHHYGCEAAYIYFPFPKRLGKRPKRRDGQLLFLFTPAGLRRAASIAQCPGEFNQDVARDTHKPMLHPLHIDTGVAERTSARGEH
jgi:hypothetical protein